MAYTALYRKFRPLTFSEMVGQEHITTTLKKQIIAGRVGHAYLFNGGRGTGKTSAAKILARAVNCLNPKEGEPCNECEICKAILSGSLTDVIEMDAASNNSVEDIRSIREEVNFLPTRAKYRVYIIDEVHMLSTGAFNALLKTLEEPPEHVKFILATTEPQKLPATILSRCQRFDFKRISNDDVIKRLNIICKESDIDITESALKIIATLSEGAMRDAISILERCTGEGQGTIDENLVRDLVGIPKTSQIYSVVKSIADYNADNAIMQVRNIINSGKDLDNFLWEIIKYIKDVLIYKSTNEVDIYNEQEKNEIDEISKNISKDRLLYLIYELSELANTMKWSSQKVIIFEAGIIKACMNLEFRSEKLEVRNDVIDMPQQNTKNKQSTITLNENKNNKVAESTIQKKVQNTKSIPYWDNVINTIKQNGKMGIYVNLLGSTAREINDMTIEVELTNKNSFAKQRLQTNENKREIEKIASQEAGKTMTVRFVSPETKKKASNDLDSMINNLDIPINIIDE